MLDFCLSMHILTFAGILAMSMITIYLSKRAKGKYIADESVDEEVNAEQNGIDLETRERSNFNIKSSCTG